MNLLEAMCYALLIVLAVVGWCALLVGTMLACYALFGTGGWLVAWFIVMLIVVFVIVVMAMYEA